MKKRVPAHENCGQTPVFVETVADLNRLHMAPAMLGFGSEKEANLRQISMCDFDFSHWTTSLRAKAVPAKQNRSDAGKHRARTKTRLKKL